MFVAAAPTTPVLVRVNFDDARFNGVEFNTRARFTETISGSGNFTYIRAYSLLNGLPPDVEGGVPPATAFLSLRYQPRSRFYVEGYSVLAGRQNRLSSLDLADRRTGAARSRTNIQNFFRRGACVRGLTTPGPTGCGSAGGILIPTGETLGGAKSPLRSARRSMLCASLITTARAAVPYLRLWLVGCVASIKFGERSSVC